MVLEREEDLKKQARMASFVIAGSMIFWLVSGFVGRGLGLPGRYAFLFDLITIAALFWALWVLLRVWRERQRDGG